MEGSYEAALRDIENPHIPVETSLKKVLDNLPPVPSKRCIYRVPDRLRHVNEMVYTPRVVSLGPLHHGKESLKAMEEHKYRYLGDFLRRRTHKSLEDYIKKIKEQEEKLRDCYAETIKFNTDKFVRIILVDAVFIIEILLRNYFHEFNDSTDHIYGKSRMLPDIKPDFLLLENQLPFFILVDLLEGVSSNSNITDPRPSMMNISRTFFESGLGLIVVSGLARISSCEVEHLLDFVRRTICLPLESQAPRQSNTVTVARILSSHVEHLLDFVRRTTLESKAPRQSDTGTASSMTDQLHQQLFEYDISKAPTQSDSVSAPSMTKLHQAGVKFKVRSTERSKSLFDIQFTHGVLEIPRISIDDNTECTFRNLLAFEQCHILDSTHYIMHYLTVLDYLANTTKDVELLLEHGILDNELGDSSKVSTLINGLSLGATWNPADFYYATVCEDLNKYCKKSWHKWKANLKQNYFNTPWAAISVIAAVVLLIFTIIQTVWSVLSY